MDRLRWTVYDGSTSHATPPEHRTEIAEFLEVLEHVRANGVGYVEVRHAERDFPALALSISQGRGVVHQFASETTLLLVAGDGSLHPSDAVEMPVMDGPAVFTGAFVLTADSACDLVRAFARGTAVSDLGEWTPL